MDFNEQLLCANVKLDPPRTNNREGLRTPPYFALEVQPGITFPFAGLRIDTSTRVLHESGSPIPGLLAAGVDTSVFHRIYGGGLGYSLATGLRSARTILSG
jgi:predicted oxidoreductase